MVMEPDLSRDYGFNLTYQFFSFLSNARGRGSGSELWNLARISKVQLAKVPHIFNNYN